MTVATEREPAIPEVPPGPGVQPPFVAAPIEGRNARRWWGVGAAAAVLAACCALGGFVVGGLVLTMIPALNEQAQQAVGEYLDELIEQDWEQAYQLRCEQDRQEEDLSEFTDRVAQPPLLESYELGELDLLQTQGERLLLPVTLRYADGSEEETTYPLVQNTRTGTLQVCQHGP